jgi:hypothetical protein
MARFENAENAGCGCALLLAVLVLASLSAAIERKDWSGVTTLVVLIGIILAAVGGRRWLSHRRLNAWLDSAPARLAAELPEGESIEWCGAALLHRSSPKGGSVNHAIVAISQSCLVVLSVNAYGTGEYVSVHSGEGVVSWKREDTGEGTVVTVDLAGGRPETLAMRREDAVEFTRQLSLLRDRANRRAERVPTERLAEELAELQELVNRGVLTAEDWETAKRNLLGAPRDRVAECAASLEQLHALMKRGVLSEAEFNMKKWDLLSR